MKCWLSWKATIFMGAPDMFGKRTTYEDWAECLHPEDRPRAEKAFADTLEKRLPEYGNGISHRSAFRRRSAGSMCWARWTTPRTAPPCVYRASASTSPSANSPRGRCAKAEQLQRQKAEELETILAAMPAAVIIAKDADCIEMAGNRAAYDFLRLARHQDLSWYATPNCGEELRCVLGTAVSWRLTKCRYSALETGRMRFSWKGGKSASRMARGSSPSVRHCHSLTIRGEFAGLSERLRTLQNMKRTEVALRESEERLKFALEAAGAGTWEVSLETGELRASDRTLWFHRHRPWHAGDA